MIKLVLEQRAELGVAAGEAIRCVQGNEEVRHRAEPVGHLLLLAPLLPRPAAERHFLALAQHRAACLVEAVRRPQELHIGIFQMHVVFVVERAAFGENGCARPLEHLGRGQITVVQRVGEFGWWHRARGIGRCGIAAFLHSDLPRYLNPGSLGFVAWPTEHAQVRRLQLKMPVLQAQQNVIYVQIFLRHTPRANPGVSHEDRLTDCTPLRAAIEPLSFAHLRFAFLLRRCWAAHFWRWNARKSPGVLGSSQHFPLPQSRASRLEPPFVVSLFWGSCHLALPFYVSGQLSRFDLKLTGGIVAPSTHSAMIPPAFSAASSSALGR